jgi:hypothetical protein
MFIEVSFDVAEAAHGDIARCGEDAVGLPRRGLDADQPIDDFQGEGGKMDIVCLRVFWDEPIFVELSEKLSDMSRAVALVKCSPGDHADQRRHRDCRED